MIHDVVFASLCIGISNSVKRAIEHMTVPALMLSGSSDCMVPADRAVPIYSDMPDTICKFWGDITNGTHCHFADIPFLDPTCYNVEESFCPDSNRSIVARDTQLDLVVEYLTTFLSASMGGENDAYNTLAKQLEENLEKGLMTTFNSSLGCL